MKQMKHGPPGYWSYSCRHSLALPHKGEGGNIRSIHIPRISLIQRLKIRVETICPDLAFLCETSLFCLHSDPFAASLSLSLHKESECHPSRAQEPSYCSVPHYGRNRRCQEKSRNTFITVSAVDQARQNGRCTRVK